MPIWIPVLAGAALGAGLGAAVGPKEEPLWKRMLIGGRLGSVAGLGAGAAGLGAGSAGAAGTGTAATAVGGSAAPVVGQGTVLAAGTGANAGLGASPLLGAQGAGTVLGGSQGLAAGTAATPASLGTWGGGLTSAQAASNLGMAQPGLASSAGAMIANNPLMSAAGLGGVGMMALPGGDDGGGGGRGKTKETYPEDASWERRRSYPQFYGNRSVGGIGRSYYGQG